MRVSLLAQVLVIGLTISSVALAAPKAKTPPAKSIGSPNEGHLVGGVEVQPSKCKRIVGVNRWGLPALVSLIDRACGRVAEQHKGARLTVGDLSQRGGGDIAGHHSHESGRDVDLGFYLIDDKGRRVVAPRFATIDEDGRAKGMSHTRFDDAANWDLVEALVTDPKARILQIFVAAPLRARLLAEAARQHASPRVRDRAAAAMLQPKKGLPHDNHFHVRIACPGGDRQCVDFATKDRTAHKKPKAISRRSKKR